MSLNQQHLGKALHQYLKAHSKQEAGVAGVLARELKSWGGNGKESWEQSFGTVGNYSGSAEKWV